jgi:hypothetical protein
MIIITSSPNTWKVGAELIKFCQGTTFSHVAIIHDDLVFQASHGYVNCTHIDNFLKDNKIIYKYDIVDSAVDMDFIKKQLGKKYSTWQLIQIAIKYLTSIKITSKNDKFICSEFVGKALRLDWVNDHSTPLEIDQYLKSQVR